MTPLHVSRWMDASGTPFGVARSVLAGKLGEFVQDHGTSRLIAAPWPCPTLAEARVEEGLGGIVVEPPGRWKTQALCAALAREAGLDRCGVRIRVGSTLETSKGCGTSSVEMRAAAHALAQCLGIQLDPRRLGRMMAAVEPSDAVVSDGCALLWDYRRGEALADEVRLPHGFYVGGYPLGRDLATDAVEKSRPRYSERECDLIAAAVDGAVTALGKGDLALLGRAAIASAELNDAFYPKPELPLLRALHAEGDCLGYWVAHSGVAFGALARPERGPRLLRELTARLGAGYRLFAFSHDAETGALPFLVGCGARLWAGTTGQGAEPA